MTIILISSLAHGAGYDTVVGRTMVALACRREVMNADDMSRSHQNNVQLQFARGGRVSVLKEVNCKWWEVWQG